MRILASNPDGIGDFLLRQPLYAALEAAGHSLLLLIRPHHLPLAPLVAPQAATCVIGGDPYSEQMLSTNPAVEAAAAAAREFAPELLLIAPYQWTAFEERLAEALPDVRVAALSGRMYRGDLRGGHDWPTALHVDLSAAVHEDEPETEKNRRLAGLILGGEPRLAPPRVCPGAAHRTAADVLLARHGLRRGEFVLACVGEHADNAVRNWGLDDWAAVLAHWTDRYGRAVMLTGSESERAASERVRDAMGAAGRRAVLIFEPLAPLEPLIGLTDAARAYIGRDTGPMHLAAAMGKPVIAVFGGGHWPRFVPAARTGLVATVGVPCIGCDWVCPFERAVCIRDVPRESITAAIDALESGEPDALRVCVHEPATTTVASMLRQLRERNHVAQRRLHGHERSLRILRAEHAGCLPDVVERLRESERQVARLESRAAMAEAALAAAESQNGSQCAEIARLRSELLRAAEARHDAELRARALESERAALGRVTLEAGARFEQVSTELDHARADAARFRQYVDDLRRSRWRMLGLKLGAARRAAWEDRDDMR
ncbi:MAG: hypothetical protein IPM64_15385 [Phycisphaerales bacterium]|nr:hypothetical protein [Phycisphaerales bacterium]